MESDAKTALKQLTIAEIQRPGRLPSHEVEHLLLVLEVCWQGMWPLFNVEELSKLLQRSHPDENNLRLSVVTKVVLDSNSVDVASDVVASSERFLRIPGDLQNKILLAGAQITNVPEMKIESLTIDRPRVQAANLARWFSDHRGVLVDAVVNALLIWTSATAVPTQGIRSENKLSIAEQRGALLKIYLRSPADLRDVERVTAAFKALDEAKIRLPDRAVINKKRRQPRPGTWTDLLKNRTWLKQLGPTLRRDLYERSALKSKVDATDKKSQM